jgi:peptide deformylase
MPLNDLNIVALDLIPNAPYETPSDDLPRLYATAKRMEMLCRRLGGLGLAAAQVGIPWRMFVFRGQESQDFGCYFDCEYRPASDATSISVEGCLSLPGEQYGVERYEEVIVFGQELLEGPDGPISNSFTRPYSGLMSVLMQHEIDHERGRERMIDIVGRRLRVA